MLFNFFDKKEGGSREQLFVDKVYISAGAKMSGCLQLAKQQAGTLFIAWFKETAKKYKDSFTQNKLGEDRVTEVDVIDAAQLQDRTPVFLEHYPLQEKEIKLVERVGDR